MVSNRASGPPPAPGTSGQRAHPLGRISHQVEVPACIVIAGGGVCLCVMAILHEIPAGADDADVDVPTEGSSPTYEKFAMDANGNPVRLPPEASDWILDDSDSDELEDEEEPTAQDLYEEIQDNRMSEPLESSLDLLIWCMPFIFVFELLNVLIQQQYQVEVTLLRELKTVVSRLPGTSFSLGIGADTFFQSWSCSSGGVGAPLLTAALRDRRAWLVQSTVFLLGTLSGGHFIYLVNEVRCQSNPGALW